MKKPCKKRKHKDKKKALNLARHLSHKYNAHMIVYKCNRCEGSYYHLAEDKSISYIETRMRKRG